MGFKIEVDKAIEAAARMRPSEEAMNAEPGTCREAEDWLAVMAALSFAQNAASVMEGLGKVADALASQGQLPFRPGLNRATQAMPIVLERFGVAGG